MNRRRAPPPRLSHGVWAAAGEARAARLPARRARAGSRVASARARGDGGRPRAGRAASCSRGSRSPSASSARWARARRAPRARPPRDGAAAPALAWGGRRPVARWPRRRASVGGALPPGRFRGTPCGRPREFGGGWRRRAVGGADGARRGRARPRCRLAGPHRVAARHRTAAHARTDDSGAYVEGLRARLDGKLDAATERLRYALSAHGDACRAAGRIPRDLPRLSRSRRHPRSAALRAENSGPARLPKP